MRVLRGANLFDGKGGPMLANSSVVVDAGRITEVGCNNDVVYPDDVDVVDISGLTLIPGLIDCHDHLGHSDYGLLDRWGLDAPASYRHVRTTKTLRDKIEMGYTAVRDGGGLDQGFKQAVDDGLIPGPRLMLSISIISPTGGLADTRSPSGHCCPAPLDLSLPSGVADGVNGVRTKVREMVRMGADVIKCATTGGASSRPGHGPKDKEFNEDEIRALVDEAHSLGRKVMCHALGGPGIRLALEAGVDSIEHGTYLNQDPELIPMMAEKGIFYVPTLLVYVFHRDNPQSHIWPRARALYRNHIESIQQALEAGVKVVAGTDAGGWGHPLNARELQCMVEEAEMSPEQALLSATGLAAGCLGLEREIGTIELGKLGDMVAIKGDPVEDIKVLQDRSAIKLVIKDGEICVDRRNGLSG